MTFRTQLAYAAAAVTLLLGLLALLNPMASARLLGLAISAPRGLSELRSGYGATLLAAAGLMLWALPLRPKTAALLRTLALLAAAAAAGRMTSLALDAVFSVGNLVALIVQLFVAGALLWASGERPASKRERAAERAARDARDAAASAQVAALEAMRGGVAARVGEDDDERGGSARPGGAGA